MFINAIEWESGNDQFRAVRSENGTVTIYKKTWRWTPFMYINHWLQVGDQERYMMARKLAGAIYSRVGTPSDGVIEQYWKMLHLIATRQYGFHEFKEIAPKGVDDVTGQPITPVSSSLQEFINGYNKGRADIEDCIQAHVESR